MAALHCERCAQKLPASAVRLDLGVVSCPHCQSVYSLQPRAVRRRAPAAIPTRFTVRDDGTGLHVTWRWFTWHYPLLVLWCIAWDGMMIAMLRESLRKGVFPWFGLLHIAAGIGVTAWCLMGFTNRSQVVATADRVEISHGPLWWPPRRSYARGELTQLYVTTGSRRWGGKLCRLHAVDPEGRKRTLLRFIPSAEEALYLEQAIEQQLGIEDAPVDGELATRG